MKLEIGRIAQIIGAETPDTSLSHPISYLLTDSRDLTFPDTTLFVALRTDVNDGHLYIPHLYSAGVRHFVMSTSAETPTETMPDATFLRVESPLKALQKIGAYARSLYSIPVVGITGSRGKTVQKELIYRTLRSSLNVVRSPRSYNSQIGVPLSLWELNPDTDLAVFEAGISLPGEMERLQQMIKPTIGVFASLTDEHSQGFSSLSAKAAEKAQLMKGCSTVIIPAEGENASLIKDAVVQAAPEARIIATAPDNKSMVEAVIRELGIENADLKTLLDENEKITSRIDVTETLKNCIIVADSFTNDMQSVHLALNSTVRHLTPGRKLTAILVGRPRDYDNAALSSLLLAKGVERFIGIGIRETFDGVKCEHFESVEQFMYRCTISDFEDEVILVKGEARSGAEEIKALLEAPRHETVLEVDLGAITANFNFFRSRLKPSTGIVAMVKAAGYGVGALELAKTLQNQGASYLAVAVIDEGAELRRAGISMPIIVMNPIGTNYKALFDNELEPSVFSLRELSLLIDNAKRYGITDYPVHIKLDTGMHRLGFLQQELPELIEVLSKQSHVKVKSIFSHLATADCLDQNEYTEYQLATFKTMSEQLMSALNYRVLRHVLNTAGILRYPRHQYDMVRLGIGLYGVAPIDGYKLQPVARLLSTIISIKHWEPGVSIGYGRRGIVEEPSTIATVAIGYADGLNRHLSRGNAYMLVNGRKCKIIGNICMDQCMIDVTGADASIGDTVEIFGTEAPIERLADTLDTIPYEILTSVSPRVKRIYFRE